VVSTPLAVKKYLRTDPLQSDGSFEILPAQQWVFRGPMGSPAIVVGLGLVRSCNQRAVEHEGRLVEVTETVQAQPNTAHEACVCRRQVEGKTIVRERFDQTSSTLSRHATHLKKSPIASSLRQHKLGVPLKCGGDIDGLRLLGHEL
jgi:hypothetical protein